MRQKAKKTHVTVWLIKNTRYIRDKGYLRPSHIPWLSIIPAGSILITPRSKNDIIGGKECMAICMGHVLYINKHDIDTNIFELEFK